MKQGLSWRALLRTVALGVALTGVGVWWAGGAHWGWTQTSVPVRTLDEVTGLEAITYRSKFVPGVDFLAASLVVAGLVAGASFVIRRDASVRTRREVDSP